MRTIKFRVWDGNKMYQFNKGDSVNLCFFSEGIPWGVYDSATEQRYVSGDPKAILNEPGIIMQFTGLFDKNGIPIYEGDLIQSEDIPTDRDGDIWTVDVRFEDGCFCYGENGDPLEKQECQTEMEVIGNICQTKNWKQIVDPSLKDGEKI